MDFAREIPPLFEMHGAYDPDKVELASIEPPPLSQGSPELPSAAVIAAIQ